jgi:hypothetical protein
MRDAPLSSKEASMKKIMIILLATVSALLALTTNSYPSGWKEVSRDEVSMVYYNPERIETSGQNRRTFYTKTEWALNSLLVVKGEYFISKYEVNCKKTTIRLLERQYFDVNGVPGTIENIHNLALLQPSAFQEENIDNGTLFWFNLACEQNKKP